MYSPPLRSDCAILWLFSLACANPSCNFGVRCRAAGLGSGLCDWRKPAPSEAISPKHSRLHVLKLEGSAVRLPGQIFAELPPGRDRWPDLRGPPLMLRI